MPSAKRVVSRNAAMLTRLGIPRTIALAIIDRNARQLADQLRETNAGNVAWLERISAAARRDPGWSDQWELSSREDATNASTTAGPGPGRAGR